MAVTTDIEWCDSTLNIMMGCDGCELWNPAAGVRHCYAGTLTERYGGKNPGFPAAFDQPKLFLGRLDAALRWPDLTGAERPAKPWLNGHPRMIFLNDMGDTFTDSLPLDWLAPILPRLAASPHVFMVLTKRARRMRTFAANWPLPANVWPGVSLTTQRTLMRLSELKLTKGGGPKWASVEPLLEAIDFADGPADPESTMGAWSMLDGLGLVVAGGESGPKARPCDLAHLRSVRVQCKAALVSFFLKQAGANPVIAGQRFGPHDAEGFPRCWKCGHFDFGPTAAGLLLCNGCDAPWDRLRDPKGGDLAELPLDVRVREFPAPAGRP